MGDNAGHMANSSSPPVSSERRIRVFISYSRKDWEQAERLLAGLEDKGFEPFLDAKQIEPGEPWRERLSALIIQADAVVFLISPDSIQPTSTCDWELNETERLGKRLIPIVVRLTPDEDVPSILRRLNWVSMLDRTGWLSGLENLTRSLASDIAWVREHSRICELAARWAIGGGSAEHELLRGKAIDTAELWVSSRPQQGPGTPSITEEQVAYIKESRQAEHARAEREREQLARTRWLQKWFGRALAGVGTLVLLMLVGATWQSVRATKREARVFASLAHQASDAQNYESAMRMAIQGAPMLGRSPIDLAWSDHEGRMLEAKLAGAAQLSPLLTVLRGHAGGVNDVAIDADGLLVVTASQDGTAKVWENVSPAGKAAVWHEVRTLRGHSAPILSLAWSAPIECSTLNVS